MLRRSVTALIVGLTIFVGSAVASAEVILGGAGGVFVPYTGKAGPDGLVQVLTPSGKGLRFGGEIEYRSYESSIFDVDNVHFDSISFRGLLEYKFIPDGVSPYVGAGFGLNVNIIDGSKVKRDNPSIIDVTDFGVGIGLLGLAGIEVPFAERMALFAEGRLGFDFQLTNQTESSSSSGDIGVSNLGGVGGIAGLRVKF